MEVVICYLDSSSSIDSTINSHRLLLDYLDPISVIEQCLQLRERRNGVDRCLDEVQSSLHDELRTMRQGEMVLGRTVHEATEQIRLLRSCKYQLDRDLADKSKASEIDSTTAGLADSVVSDSRTPRYINYAHPVR